MEKEGFLLRLEEEDTLELWATSNLPLQFSLLTEALWLWPVLLVLPVLPGLRELILTKIMVEVGLSSPSFTCKLGRSRG